MASTSNIENHLKNILSKSNNNLNLSKNYTLDVKSSIGNGFIGQFYKVSVEDKEAKKKYQIVAKQAPWNTNQRNSLHSDLLYRNEIYFYATLVPALEKLQKTDFVPKYVTSDGTENEEIIILEDVSANNYIMRDKVLLLDDDHVELIFSTYGHFHARSFVWRDKNPEEYQESIKPIHNVYLKLSEKPFGEMMYAVCQRQAHFLDPENDAELIKKFQKYVDTPKEVFQTSIKYNDRYSAILHGDCWSNNMMFKYNDSKPVAMKLLDFQMLHDGTPVYDLSYFFYVGGTKEHFDRLEYYLDIYYQNFSDTARKLGSNPEILYPRKKLSEEWKEYAKFGFFLSCLLTRIKHMPMEDTIKFAKENAKAKPECKKDLFMNVKCDEEAFAKRIKEIMIHMSEIHAL